MENAVKALFMAAGVLLAILVIGVLMYSLGLTGDFLTSNAEKKEEQRKVKFNNQFINYERPQTGYIDEKDIMQNALTLMDVVSLVNKVIDNNIEILNLTTTDLKNMRQESGEGAILAFILAPEEQKQKLTGNKTLEILDKKYQVYNGGKHLVNLNLDDSQIGCSDTKMIDEVCPNADIEGKQIIEIDGNNFKNVSEECKILHRYSLEISLDDETGCVCEITIKPLGEDSCEADGQTTKQFLKHFE